MVNTTRIYGINKMIEYKYEDIFEINPDNPEEMLMKIPDEILEAKGWGEGTKVKITFDENTQAISIEEVDEIPNGKK